MGDQSAVAVKRCSRCQQVKPFSAFSKNRSRPDGHSVWCLDCYKWSRQRFDHLDRPFGKRDTLHDAVIGEPWPKRTDDSWEKVCRGMAYLLHDKVLKPAQVDVLMMHVVENLPFHEIASMVGMSQDGVKYHYKVAIRKLREMAVSSHAS